MSENKFLSFVLTESIILLCLGLLALILPKISYLSFGLMISSAFIIYGGYKIINSIMIRNIIRHYRVDIFMGIILFLAGLVLFFAPYFDITQIMVLIGIYFVLKSISSLSFSVQVRKILNFWWLGFMLSILEIFFGLLTIIFLPTGALWFIGILSGIDFILSGFCFVNMYISTKYIKEV